RVRIGYTPFLFVPLAMLQAAVFVRVLTDLFFIDWRWVSGVLTVLALAAFAALAVAAPKPGSVA
ncbi:MAG TPA: hypothetical protein VL017_11535, partial [Devosia sp.]|nr:hypothetical protein [Devosia sp.]